MSDNERIIDDILCKLNNLEVNDLQYLIANIELMI